MNISLINETIKQTNLTESAKIGSFFKLFLAPSNFFTKVAHARNFLTSVFKISTSFQKRSFVEIVVKITKKLLWIISLIFQETRKSHCSEFTRFSYNIFFFGGGRQ